MDPDTVRTRLQEIGLNDDQIEEVLPLLADQAGPADSGGPLPSSTTLTMALRDEPDWRKRAVLAAQIISASLGT